MATLQKLSKSSESFIAMKMSKSLNTFAGSFPTGQPSSSPYVIILLLSIKSKRYPIQFRYRVAFGENEPTGNDGGDRRVAFQTPPSSRIVDGKVHWSHGAKQQIQIDAGGRWQRKRCRIGGGHRLQTETESPLDCCATFQKFYRLVKKKKFKRLLVFSPV